MIAKRMAFVIIIIVVAWASGCDHLPGKPTEEERWVAPSQISDFAQLYARNCSGCHGADGRLGAARPLNDPLYLNLVSPETLRQVIKQGVPSTTMPAFGETSGGNLTDAQVDLIVEQMRTRWAQPDEFKDATVPPYSAQPGPANERPHGDPQRGAAAYVMYCAQCHGVDGSGGSKGGSIIDPNFLKLVSDQSLRTTVIAGRQDIGKPDWRANIPGRAMSLDEISDVVSWLAAQRPSAPTNESAPNEAGSSSKR